MNNYFSHDSNARNDEKLIRLRMKKGAAGYGVYFMILERMRDEEDYTCAKDYDMIAFDLREDAELIRSVVEDFDLFCFTNDGASFYSPSFMKRMDSKDGVSKRRSESGRKGAEARWQKTESKTKESEEKKEPPSPPPTSAPMQEDTLEEEKLEFEHNIPWIETVCMRFQIPPQEVLNHIDDFFLDCRARGKLSHNNLMDAKSHFADWLRIKLKQQNNGNNINSTTTSQQRAENYAARIGQLIAEDRQEATADH